MRSSRNPYDWSHFSLASVAGLLVGLLLQPSWAATPQNQPLVATTSPDFVGYDGSWSAISIRVGSPQQYLSVLPSTLSQETWVVGPAGCDGTTTCTTKRGGLFSPNESNTFQERGLYELTSNNAAIGYYGLDTVYLTDVVSTPEQIIATINSTDQWIGTLGLGVQQTRFNGTENLLPLLSGLVQNGSSIPSHSYGYTAGAFYRLKSVPASLILGGLDANRFVPNDMTFSLGPDYAPIVAINAISVSASPSGSESLPANWNSNPVSLLDTTQAELFTIDSSTPFLWLPEAVCDNFANALNLTYNEALELYLYENTTSPDALASWNLTFTFSVGDLPGSSNNTQLTLPYDAFNLQLTYPFPNLDANFTSPPTNYFPLRRAANATQFIIGRSFLQETYLTVDYERNNFSLSQAIFTLDAVSNVNLISISRPENSIWPGPAPYSGGSTGSSLPTGVKAGIGIAVAVGALLVAALVWYFCIAKKHPSNRATEEKANRRSILNRLHLGPDSKTSVSELLGDKRHPTEVPADSSTTRFELTGTVPIEMAAAEEVSHTYLESRDGSGIPSRNDPRNPAELEPQDPTTKEAEVAAAAAAGGSQRSTSPVPPYSPAEISNRYSNSISPYTPRHSQGFGTVSSGEQGVSPVGASRDGSRQSSNGTSSPSPVSPEVTMTRPPQEESPRAPSHNPSTRSSYGTLLVPQLNGRPPSRSPSTGSRFVEQGLTAVAEENSVNVPARAATRAPRFSWEQ